MAPGPLPVQADPTQLQQTIINLATNARDAMTGGGTLTIETERVDRAPAGTTLPEGRYVALAVRDTGAGMDEATRRLVFHPFFTTKEVGKGTGLGLATVHGIVEQSGGHVLVESEPGHGSCFRVFLPLVGVEKIEVAASAVRRHRRPAVLRQRRSSSLKTRRSSVKSLRGSSAGRVTPSSRRTDGEQALQMVRRHTAAIDLVISDVVMAKLGGLDLAKRLTSERPGLPVLLVSGYNREEMTDDPSRTISFLRKPFTPGELLEKVSTLLTLSRTHLNQFPA